MGKKLTSRKAKEKKAAKLWSEIIRSIGYCVRCGSQEMLAAHHIIYKSKSNYLRYDIDNGICLCNRKCHMWIHHESPTVVTAFLVEKLGRERIDILNAGRQQIVKTNIAWLDNWLEILEEQHKKI